MTLISPGVRVNIIDESQYVPAATNSVPYILLATASNKASGAGVGTAAGTLPTNANKTYLLTSQRDLLATFGVPKFYTDTAGNPLNGYELNEYGLLAAYSALGVTNRCFVQRANINLQDLTASLVRPLGSPNNGAVWADTANTTWGLFQWNQVTGQFTNQVPTVFTDDTYLTGTVPSDAFGSIGDYGVVTTTVFNPIYFKRGGAMTGTQTSSSYLGNLYNTWVLLGSKAWESSWATVTGTLGSSTTTLTAGGKIAINGTTVTVPGAPNNTIPGLSDAINAANISGVYAATIGNKLMIFADRDATSGSALGTVYMANDPTSTANILAQLGILQQTYYIPVYNPAPSYQFPRWRTTDTHPEPTGSVWQKTNNVNLGANLVVKRWSSVLNLFVQQNCPLYLNDQSANFGLDPTGGGLNIPKGSTYARYKAVADGTAQIELFERVLTGPTVIAGSDITPSFIAGNRFTLSASQSNSTTMNSATITLTGTTAVSFCSDVSAANVPFVSAYINSAGQVVFQHSQGGIINLIDTIGQPIYNAGFTTAVPGIKDYYVGGVSVGVSLSNWAGSPTFTYTASNTAPDQDPADGTYWYYSDPTESADIMIQNNGQWMGYLNVTNDVRGYNLSLTDPNGPIFSANAPQEQSSGLPLKYGDLWVNTSDLDNYPIISRWESIDGNDQWVLVDNTDQTTENGVLFSNARWASNGTTNPITDPVPSITGLLRSDYVDLDAPDPELYPQGMLLFNLRRSGYNVKKFMVNYFNAANFPILPWSLSTNYQTNEVVTYNSKYYIALAPSTAVVPTSNATLWALFQTNAWESASANANDGSPTMGRKSQRAIIVAALKSGIDTSVSAREEQLGFNLLSCPQYPELGINLVALNDERNQTAFIISDTPLRLTPGEIRNWATNSLTDPVDEPLDFASQYAGVWYPSCQTTDLGGNYVVQPPSHMMIRTILRSDSVSYPWMAPAGTRRGVVDNAIQIGYIQSATGEFISLGVNQGIRDILYENSVNPITFIPGVGITAYGQKTITSIASALDRINVARLIVFIRTRLEYIGKQYLFEPNDQITRNEFSNAVNSLCVDLVAKRALYDYAIVCDLTNNTPARIDRNELWLDLAIEPVKAVEFIYIPVRIKNTGEIAAATGGNPGTTQI